MCSGLPVFSLLSPGSVMKMRSPGPGSGVTVANTPSCLLPVPLLQGPCSPVPWPFLSLPSCQGPVLLWREGVPGGPLPAGHSILLLAKPPARPESFFLLPSECTSSSVEWASLFIPKAQSCLTSIFIPSMMDSTAFPGVWLLSQTFLVWIHCVISISHCFSMER